MNLLKKIKAFLVKLVQPDDSPVYSHRYNPPPYDSVEPPKSPPPPPPIYKEKINR